ncbi:MAG: hypothetical protein AAF907_09800, partial [Planctomycetota bacterium]
FDLTGWTRITATGADAAAFLQKFCTNDLLKSLADGHAGCEAFFTSERARVLGHGWLLRGAGDTGTVEFVGTPGQAEGLLAHLPKYALMEDVEFADATGQPLWFETTEEAWPTGDPLEHGSFQFSPVPAGAIPLTESARIVAKLPLIGTDLTDTHLCVEADRPWAICYTKGCYLGQEPVARIRALGKVNKLQRGFRLPPDSPPPQGDAKALGEDGKEVGFLTSAADRFGLGFLKRRYVESGGAVTVEGMPAEVF